MTAHTQVHDRAPTAKERFSPNTRFPATSDIAFFIVKLSISDVWSRESSRLVLGGHFFHMVDCENFNRTFLRFQPKSKLFLDGRKDRRSRSVECWCAVTAFLAVPWAPKHLSLSLVGRPLEREIVNPRESGLVHYGTA